MSLFVGAHHLFRLPASAALVNTGDTSGAEEKSVFISEGSESKSKQEDFWIFQLFGDILFKTLRFEGRLAAVRKLKGLITTNGIIILSFSPLRPTSGGKKSKMTTMK